MAKITVFLKGKKVSECRLEPGKEYTLGRGSQCDILLDSQDVSRRHLLISFDGENWNCEVISKYGHIFINGQAVSSTILQPGMTFGLSSYEIKFEGASPNTMTRIPTESRAPDKTVVGQLTLKPVLFRLDETDEPVEEITLGLGLIEAGRSSKCQIRLHDESASRRQFSISYEGNGFVLTDLGSHSTYINGKPIKLHTLESGDEIVIGIDHFRYELINPVFEHLPARAVPTGSPAVIRIPPENKAIFWVQQRLAEHFPKAVDYYQNLPPQRKKRLKIISATSMVVILLAVIFSDTGKKQKYKVPPMDKNSEAAMLAKLTPDQRKFLDETYYLSLNLYTTGKYDLAALELEKIFQLVPNYKDAMNIKAHCIEALEIKKEKQEHDRLVVEQSELQEKVKSILNDCEILIMNKKYDEVEACIQQITDMDPENARARYLVETAKLKMSEIAGIKERQETIRRNGIMAKKNYDDAIKSLDQKRYPAAVQHFSRVINLAFEDKEGLKEKAKIGLQSVKEKMLSESDVLVKEGKTAFDSRDFRSAVAKFSRALEIYPDHQEAKKLKEKALTELYLDVKNMYTESVIEENMGNIESAKKKWHTIIDSTAKDNPYNQKARIKLGKYEK